MILRSSYFPTHLYRPNHQCIRSLATPSTEILPLPRSINPTRALLLLHIPLPPTQWPARLELASSLISQTIQSLKDRQIAVNAIYDPSLPGSPTPFDDKDEIYPARLVYPDGRVFRFPKFSSKTLDSLEFQARLRHRPDQESLSGFSMGREAGGGEHEVLVCTHGSRDCRCSDRGGALVEALRAEIGRRGVEGRVMVHEIAHVGGHKYAANAILLPSLDMLSNLNQTHAPAVISHILTGRPKGSGMWEHWRGRYGLNEAQQMSIWKQVDPSPAAEDEMRTTGVVGKEKEKVLLRFKTYEGDVKEIEAEVGKTLLEVGKVNGLPALEGVCGGNLGESGFSSQRDGLMSAIGAECATCHLYLPLDPPPPVPEAGDEESDMLGYAIGFKEGRSRLGCQIKVTKALGEWVKKGGVVELPRY